MTSPARGRFITFEGGEGAGKSTQARLLVSALRSRGIDAFLTREPGGTAGAEAVRALLLENEGPGWNSRAEALLFAAARADHVERLIRPALESGRWVVCDRFIDSSRAYQGYAGGLGDDTVLALHRIGSNGLMPDCTVLLMLDPELVDQRLHERDGGSADRIGGRGSAYHKHVAEAFARLAVAEPERFITIDGMGDPQAVHERLLAALRGRWDELR